MQYARTADGEWVHASEAVHPEPSEEFLKSLNEGDGYYYHDDGTFVVVPFADHPDSVLTEYGWQMRYGPNVPFRNAQSQPPE